MEGTGRTACAGLAVVGALLVLAPVVFTQRTLEGFELLKVALLLLAALALVVLGTSTLPRPRQAVAEAVREPLALGLVLMLLSAAVSTAVSISGWTSLVGAHESFSGLPTVLGYTVLFFAVRTLVRTPAVARALLVGPVVASAAVAGYAWVQVLGVDPLPWERVATLGERVRTFSTLGHPNHLAAYLAMALPFTVLWAERAAALKRYRTLALLGLVGVLSVGAVAASLSRSGWLALACAAAVLAVGWPRRSQRRGAWVAGMVLAAGLALVLVLVLRTPGAQEGWLGALSERVRRFGEGDTRLHIWRAALEIFSSHPLVGSGLDTFQLAFEGARTPEYWRLEWNGTPAKAHNQALHLLATQGLLGAAALGVLAVGLALAIRRAWRRVAPEDRPLVVALTASVSAFATQNLFNFTVAATGIVFTSAAGLLSGLGREGQGAGDTPSGIACLRGMLPVAAGLGGLSFLLTLFGPGAPSGGLAGKQWLGLLGLAALFGAVTWSLRGLLRVELPATVAQRHSHGRGFGWREAVVWGAALALALWGVVRPLSASAECRTGQALLVTAPERAVPHLERAVALDPTRDVCLAKLGTAALLIAKTTADGGVRRRELERARTAFSSALARVPVESYHHANLGRLRTELARDGLGTAAEAFAAYDAALALDPANGHILADASLSALILGDTARARQYAARAVALYPDFAPPLAVLGFLALQEGNDSEAVRLLRQAYEGHWRGDENARRIALGNLAAALLRVGRPDQALGPAREAVELTPDNAELRFNLGRALELLGKRDEAAAEYQRVLSRHPGYAPAREALQALQGSPAPRGD
jgi:O-antigen ligase/tetratricopeptide (TPR) repeat protein